MELNLKDWESCTTIFMNVLVGLSTGAGAIIAGLGLQAWRYELRGRTDFELARRVMLCVYQLRNEFHCARDEFSPRVHDTHAVRLNEKACELDNALLEAKILWGNTLNPPKQKIKECLSSWRVALREYRRKADASPNSSDQGDHVSRTDATLNGDVDDAFGQRIEEAIRDFEAATQRHLNCSRQNKAVT